MIKSFCARSENPGEGIVVRLLCLRSKVFLLASLLVTLSLILCSSHAAEIESVIPVHSVAYAVVKDVPRIWSEMEASSSWQSFLSSEELDSEMRHIRTIIGWAREFLGVDLRALVEVFGQRIALVQVYMDPIAAGPPVVIADVSDPEGAAEMIRNIERKLGSGEGYEDQSHTGTYQTVPFGLVKLKGEELTVRYAFLGNLFVFAPGRDAFEAVVDVYLGQQPSLIHDPKFHRMRDEWSEAEGQVFVYVNLEHSWPIALRMWPSEWRQVLQMLGAHEIKSVAWTTNLLASTRDQEMYIYTGGNRMLLSSLFAEPKPLFSPHLIPSSGADMFFAMHLGNPIVAWEEIKDAVRSVVGEEGYAYMQSEILEFEQYTGLSLRDDILSSLTGEMGFAMPFPEAMKPLEGPESLLENGLVIFCGVKDRENCLMSIERVLSAADVPLQQIEYRGMKVYQIPAISSSESPVGYMLAGDILVFGDLQRFQDIINEEPPLIVSEKFALLNSQFPQQLGFLCYIDLGKAAEMLLTANLEIHPEHDMARLQTLGSIGGMLIYDGEGLKGRSVGTPGKSWLETIADLAHILIRVRL